MYETICTNCKRFSASVTNNLLKPQQQIGDAANRDSSAQTMHVLRCITRLLCPLIVTVCVLVVASVAAFGQNYFGLGVAGPQNYAVVNLGGSFQFNSNSTSSGNTITGQGNVAIVSGSSANVSGGFGNITSSTGTLYLGPGLSSSNFRQATFAGGVVTGVASLSSPGTVLSAAINAASTLKALKADQTFSGVYGTTTITATHSGQNVIQVNGSVTGSLTVSQGTYTNVTFVVNVTGNVIVGNNGGIFVASGMSPLSVIYNIRGNFGFVATGNPGIENTDGSIGPAATNGPAPDEGIILCATSANQSIDLDSTQLYGALIGYNVAIVNGGRLNNPTPEPAVPVFLASILTATIIGRRKHRGKRGRGCNSYLPGNWFTHLL